HPRRRQVETAVRVGEQHEVVLCAVAFAKTDAHHVRLRGFGQLLHRAGDQIRIARVEPGDALVPAEPGPLPADAPAGRAGRFRSRRGEVTVAVERFDDLLVAQRLGRRPPFAQTLVQQLPDLVHQALLEHALHPGVYARS